MKTQPEERACTRFCRIPLDEDSVENFILWLCGRSPEQTKGFMESTDEPTLFDPVEDLWGWNAPRQRMAKLLWCFLHGASDEEFHSRFYFGDVVDNADCATLLPIQERLKSVMVGLLNRQEQDRNIGQGDWGETWWLPDEETDFVRDQLKNTHAELVEQPADYGDAVAHSLCFHIRHVVKAISVPCSDPERFYVGERVNGKAFLSVHARDGCKFPLRHSTNAYVEANGTGFEWGYGGHGPSELTRCILTDALDGDLEHSGVTRLLEFWIAQGGGGIS